MVRLDRNYPAIWFGEPGKLQSFPYPRGGIEKPYERQTFDFVTGSGAHQVSSLMTGSRPITLTWNALHVDNYAKLEQYRTGMNGGGPWVLIDPSQLNLLPANVGASMAVFNDDTGFLSALGDQGTPQINADSTLIHRPTGARSIRWRFTVTAGSTPTLGVVPQYRSWPGHPVVPGLSYAWSSWMRPDGVVDSAITASMKLEWLNAAGGSISTSSSSNTALTTAWNRVSVIATAPSNAAYVKPTWVADGSTVTVLSSIYIDEPLLEQDNVVNDWAPSTGIKPVEVISLPDVVPNFASRFRQGVVLQLRELAR